MSCPNCNPNHNPHNEFTEAYYDYEYVDSLDVSTYCECSEMSETTSLEEMLNEAIEELSDVSDIVSALREMDPDNPDHVNALIEGVAFYDETVLDMYGSLSDSSFFFMSDEEPSTLRVLKIDASDVDYVSDLHILLKVISGDLSGLFYCEDHGDEECQLDGNKSPLRMLECMRALTRHRPEALVIGNHADYKGHEFLDPSTYEEERTHIVTIEYPDEYSSTGGYTYSFLIDRETRKAYLI